MHFCRFSQSCGSNHQVTAQLFIVGAGLLTHAKKQNSEIPTGSPKLFNPPEHDNVTRGVPRGSLPTVNPISDRFKCLRQLILNKWFTGGQKTFRQHSMLDAKNKVSHRRQRKRGVH